MAKFTFEMPMDMIKELETLEMNTPEMMKAMTDAGATVVYNNIMKNIDLPNTKTGREIIKSFKVARAVKGRKFSGYATRVYSDGYVFSSGWSKGAKKYPDKGVPIPLIIAVMEFGSTYASKKPFYRKSWKKAEIEDAMKAAQKQYISNSSIIKNN